MKTYKIDSMIKGGRVEINEETQPVICFILLVLAFLEKCNINKTTYKNMKTECIPIYFINGHSPNDALIRKLLKFDSLLQECKPYVIQEGDQNSKWLLSKKGIIHVGRNIFELENTEITPERMMDLLSGELDILDRIKQMFFPQWQLCYELYAEEINIPLTKIQISANFLPKKKTNERGKMGR